MLEFLIHFLLYITIVYGINQIITESSLFRDFREHTSHTFIKKIVNCFLCNSVWISFIISFTFWSPCLTAFGNEFLHGVIYTTFKQFWDYNQDWLDVLFSIYWGIICIICSFMDAMIGSTIVWFMHLIERLLISKLTYNKGK